MSQINQTMVKPFKTSSFSLWLPTLFVLVTGSLLAIIIFLILAYQLIYLNRIYPGVQVANVNVGGMTQAEVMAAVSQRAPEYLARRVTIAYGPDTWTFTGQELGMQVDAAQTAQAAYAVGRKGNLIADLLTHVSLRRNPRQIEPVILYDPSPTKQVLQDLAAQVNRAPQDARLVIHPDAQIEVIEPQFGRRMHIEATQPLIEAALFENKGQVVSPVVQQVLPAITDVEAARQQAKNLVGQPLVFRFAAETGPMEWRLEPAELVSMIDVAEIINDAGKPEFSITPNREKFRAYLEQMAATIQQEPIDARLEFKPETNQLMVLQESQEGRSLDVEATLEQVMALKNNPSHRVELPVGVIPPLVSSKNLDSLGIKALVSEATTYFKGSNEARMQNIALSASRFNGVVVPPGEVFSFNEHLGPVTKEAGFNESLVIQGNRTSVGLGGGVCQVSTTAFRAAFFGGYELVERWAHGYRVGWYETNSAPGLDATVYTPDVDLKFRNDTAYYLLIQTSTDLDAGTVTFRFYSTPTGREVTVTEPETSNPVKHGPPLYEEDPALPTGVTKQVDWAVDGLDVLVKRTVKEGGTVIHQDEIFSHYQPWQAVYKVGTGG
ncbi:MAG: VanW family protein [Chloroflexota bacterium]|nr:MAG: VanW family protein [Chloroflexota bacterium]